MLQPMCSSVHHLYFVSEPLDLYSWLPNSTDTFAKTNMMNKGNLPLAFLHEQAVILFRFYTHSWKIGCNDDNADSDDDDNDNLQWFISCRMQSAIHGNLATISRATAPVGFSLSMPCYAMLCHAMPCYAMLFLINAIIVIIRLRRW